MGGMLCFTKQYRDDKRKRAAARVCKALNYIFVAICNSQCHILVGMKGYEICKQAQEKCSISFTVLETLFNL